MKISLPMIAIGAVAAYAVMGSSKPKQSTASIAPFTITCESINIKDPIKTDIWFTEQAREYIRTLPDLESLSYHDLVAKILQKLNKLCYDKFVNNTLNDNQTLLVAILRDKAQKGFITAYFGDPATLSGDDKINYNQFAEVIHPERLADFSTKIKWTTELDKKFNDVLKSVNLYNKWP